MYVNIKVKVAKNTNGVFAAFKFFRSPKKTYKVNAHLKQKFQKKICVLHFSFCKVSLRA